MLARKSNKRLARQCFQLLRLQKSSVVVYQVQIRALKKVVENVEAEPRAKQQKTKVNARFVRASDQDSDNNNQADKSDPPKNLFTNSSLKDLQDQGLEANNCYWLICQLVKDSKRQLLLQQRMPISIIECSINKGKRLCQRGQIQLPLFKLL